MAELWPINVDPTTIRDQCVAIVGALDESLPPATVALALEMVIIHLGVLYHPEEPSFPDHMLGVAKEMYLRAHSGERPPKE